MKRIFYSLFLSLVLSLLFFSCKITEPPLPEPVKVPLSFRGESDSTHSVADIPWRDFFSDKDLVNLIDITLKNNPDMHIALQRVEMARSKVQIRKSALLPSVSGVVTAGQRRFGEYTMDGIGNYDTNFSDNLGEEKRIPEHLPDYFIGLQSTWEIDIWKKLRHAKRAAYTRLLSSEKGRHWVTTSLVTQVASLYYELLSLDNELDIIRENIRLQENAVEIIHIQKSAGRATALAVKQFNAQLLNTKSMETEIVQQIVTIENMLNQLSGRFDQPVKRNKDALGEPLHSLVEAGIPSQMLNRRPDIKQAELMLEAAHADLQAARAAFFPSLTISPSVGLRSFNASQLFNPASLAYSVLGGLSAPLFNRKALKARYKFQTAAQTEAFYQYQKAILSGFNEVSTSLSRIHNLRKKAGLKAQQVAELRDAVTISNELFATGYASYLEVISAQKNVLEAQLALTRTKKEQFKSVVNLYKVLGGGWR